MPSMPPISSPPTVPENVSTPGVTPSPASTAAESITADMSAKDIEMRERLLEYVYSYPPDLIRRNLVKARAKDSGTWLFTLPAFEKWRKLEAVSCPTFMEYQIPSNCFWLSGNVGAGKTMLMSAVVDHLLADVETLPENEKKKKAVLYYYFDRSLSPSPRDVIASLLRQLCSQKDVASLPPFLTKNSAALKKTPGLRRDGSDTIVTKVDAEYPAPMPIGDMVADFLSLQGYLEAVYICVDGLEECDDLVALFELLVRLAKPSTPCHLVISARPEIVQMGIMAKLGSDDMVVILEQNNAPDIRAYIEAYVNKSGFLADMIGTEHVETLTKRAGGDFLAVTTELVELGRLATKVDVNQYMKTSNIGFPELFSKIWSRLEEQPHRHAILAKRIFYWLSISRRALTLKELQQAITIETEEDRTYEALDERLSPPNLIQNVCMGFVWVDTASNTVSTSPSALPFYLYQLNASFAAEAREYAAKCCIGFLNKQIFSNGPFKSQEELDQMDQKLPFSRYVSQYWGTHLNDIEDGKMQGVAERLLGNDPLMDTMSQLLYVNRPAPRNRPKYDDYPSGFGGRHFGAYFSIEAAFKKWPFPQDWDVPKDSWGRKPLHVALTSPTLHFRNLLLDVLRGNDFKFLVSGTDPPFRKKTPTPETDMEPTATGKGDSNTKEDSKGLERSLVSTLPWTWEWVSVNITEEWLKMQVLQAPFTREETTALDNQQKTPFHHFIVTWAEARLAHVIRALSELEPPGKSNDVEVGPDVDDTDEVDILPVVADGDGRTILEYACTRNVVSVCNAFWSCTWSPQSISSAIVAVATGGHFWSLRCLFDLIRGKYGKEKLDLDLTAAAMEASKRGFTNIVVLLQRFGADLRRSNLKDNQGTTALHYAAWGNHVRTARFLLIEGADPCCVDDLGRSPLICAAESGSEGVMDLLRERGAGNSHPYRGGSSPLQLAARIGNLAVMRLLRFFESRCRLLSCSYCKSKVGSKSPLHLAAEHGHNDMVQFLIDEGSPCNSQDDDGRTPLSYACQAGPLPPIRLLLARKVGVNTQDSARRTPLSYAAAGGHIDAVVALIGQSEVDPNVADSEARSPLIHAAQNGHSDVAMLLAALGAGTKERAAVIRAHGGVLSKLAKPPACRKLVDIEHADSQGRTARDYLQQAGDDAAVAFLDAVSACRPRREPETVVAVDKTKLAPLVVEDEDMVMEGSVDAAGSAGEGGATDGAVQVNQESDEETSEYWDG